MTKKKHSKKDSKKAEKEDQKKKKDEQKKREKKEDELIEDGLKAIYEGDEKVDFSKIDRKRNRLTNILITVIVTLAVIAGLSWGAFLIYTKYFSGAEEEAFELWIDVPQEQVSGENAEILIHYNNPSTVPITALELDVRIPDTFQIGNLAPSPANEEDLIWSIGNLSAGSDGVIVISGTWIAETPSSTPVQVLANYKPANFNSDFQDIETVYIQTLDSTFDLTVEGPEEATPGEIVTYEINLKNDSSSTMEGTEVQLTLPEGFFLESSSPEIEAGASPIWTFDRLEQGSEEVISFEGTFAADVEGFQYFDVVLGVREGERLLTQKKEQGFTDVLGSDLSIQLIVDGNTDAVTTELGGNLRVTIAYENAGEVNLSDVSILLDFQSEDALPIIWNDAALDGGAITSDGILWDEFDLGTIEPGNRTLMNLIFPVASSAGSGTTDAFTLVASASYGSIDIKSSPVEVNVNSKAELLAAARYYTDDGAPLGNGPIPPTVGETTTYRIYWTINNSLHDLEDVEITATLPPHVTWVNQSDAELGSISYDSGSKIITWEVATIPTTVPKVQANFSVSITPDEDDLGAFVKLLSGSALKATDTVTQDGIESTAENLTTELLGDEFAENRGTVAQ